MELSSIVDQAILPVEEPVQGHSGFTAAGAAGQVEVETAAGRSSRFEGQVVADHAVEQLEPGRVVEGHQSTAATLTRGAVRDHAVIENESSVSEEQGEERAAVSGRVVSRERDPVEPHGAAGVLNGDRGAVCRAVDHRARRVRIPGGEEGIPSAGQGEAARGHRGRDVDELGKARSADLDEVVAAGSDRGIDRTLDRRVGAAETGGEDRRLDKRTGPHSDENAESDSSKPAHPDPRSRGSTTRPRTGFRVRCLRCRINVRPCTSGCHRKRPGSIPVPAHRISFQMEERP